MEAEGKIVKKFRKWIIDQFLPAWAKDGVYRENEDLRAEVARLSAELRERNAYIDGLERGIRAQRRITINAGGKS